LTFIVSVVEIPTTSPWLSVNFSFEISSCTINFQLHQLFHLPSTSNNAPNHLNSTTKTLPLRKPQKNIEKCTACTEEFMKQEWKKKQWKDLMNYPRETFIWRFDFLPEQLDRFSALCMFLWRNQIELEVKWTDFSNRIDYLLVEKWKKEAKLRLFKGESKQLFKEIWKFFLFKFHSVSQRWTFHEIFVTSSCFGLERKLTNSNILMSKRILLSLQKCCLRFQSLIKEKKKFREQFSSIFASQFRPEEKEKVRKIRWKLSIISNKNQKTKMQTRSYCLCQIFVSVCRRFSRVSIFQRQRTKENQQKKLEVEASCFRGS
jgi:hypothetical protein